MEAFDEETFEEFLINQFSMILPVETPREEVK